MAKISAAIFDFDGTILDSEPLHIKAWQTTLPKYTNKEFYPQIHKDVCGIPEKKVSEKLREYYKIVKISAPELLKIKKEKFLELAINESKLMDGALERIQEAQRLNLTLAIATSGTAHYVVPLLEKFDLKKYFPTVVTTDTIINGKPHPEIYEKTAEKIKKEPKECLVFEDSPNGAKSALQAGCITIAIPNSITKDLEFPPVQFIFNSFKEFTIENLIKEIGS